MKPLHQAHYETEQATQLVKAGADVSVTDTRRYSTRAFVAWLAFVLALLAVGWVIWFTTFRNDYPLNLTLLSIPYCFAGLSLTLSLRKAIQTGHDFHAGLYAVGLAVLCGLM